MNTTKRLSHLNRTNAERVNINHKDTETKEDLRKYGIILWIYNKLECLQDCYKIKNNNNNKTLVDEKPKVTKISLQE